MPVLEFSGTELKIDGVLSSIFLYLLLPASIF